MKLATFREIFKAKRKACFEEASRVVLMRLSVANLRVYEGDYNMIDRIPVQGI